MDDKMADNEAQKIERTTVPEMDEILGKPFKLLDDGFIRVIDYMGDDAAVVQAARVSYGKGTKMISEDRGLIRYLIRHWHTTPFEMCELKIHVRVPMDCWRQWIRHRTANVNEYSTRYSLAIDAAQKTSPQEWRLQSTVNKQGSGQDIDDTLGNKLTDRESQLQTLSREIYNERIEKGVSREQARKDLPLSTYTEAYWKIDLHNLLHFLRLRMDSHAQKEIRDYACTIGEKIVKKWLPLTWEAFEDYWLNSMQFSDIDSKITSLIAQDKPEKAIALAKESGWIKETENGISLRREATELNIKLERIGLKSPWAE